MSTHELPMFGSNTPPDETKISLRTSYSSEPRHRLVEFGDGYIQRTPFGPYAGRRKLSLVHEHLSAAEATTLINFYELRHDDAASIEIVSNALLDLEGNYYLESYDVEMSDDNLRTISASLIEVYGE
jgi:hypothetical protein